MKTMLTAVMALLLLINPSYGSLKRLTDALSKISKSRRSLLNEVTFHNKLRVDFVGDLEWLRPYEGDYTFIDIQNGKPAYQLTTCLDSDNCLLGQILNANVNSGKYQFGFCSRDPVDPQCKHPTCLDATDTPQDCVAERWWDSVGVGHNPTFTELGDIITEDVCSEVTDDILALFNCYRSQIALGNVKGKDGSPLPKAAKMSPLIRDAELEEAAQQCADWNHQNECTIEHCSSGNQGTAGWSGYDKYPETYGVYMWFDEKKNYQWGGSGIDHFWGVIKENHVKVGCGYAHCTQYDDVALHSAKVLVCNYESNGEPLYESNENTYPYKPAAEGDVAGSECSNGANSVTGLCNL